MSHAPVEVDISIIREALGRPRPGVAAQERMAPRPRTPAPESGPARDGGVLLLLYPLHGRLYLVLTRRTAHLRNHQGQISLPGGRQEAGESFEDTALREAHEELGLTPEEVQILGQLTPLYISASHYLIRPVVGYMPARPAFRPDAYEVAEVLEVPLSTFLDPTTVQEEDWHLRGMIVHVPFFLVKGHKVWGATAMVLAEFVELIYRVLELKTVEDFEKDQTR